MTLRIGTRASTLAHWQASWVAARLRQSGAEVVLIPIATRGDAIQREPIGSLGSPGVFTKEIQRSLLAGEIDLAVHSLKDLPTDEVPGLSLAAVPERESPWDVLVSRGGKPLKQLTPQAVIGTGSLRRRAQLLFLRPGLTVKDIRGNVDTRLRKLDDGQFDALILAEAGLKRLGLQDRITEVLTPDIMLPAIGQGALAIECRSDDQATQQTLAFLDHLTTHQAVLAERAMLGALLGGCLAPIGGLARLEADGRLRLDGAVLSPDGTVRCEAFAVGEPDAATALGEDVAAKLIAAGARQIISAARAQV